MINLVGNAIKFTDAGEVVIKATATDGSFHLSVSDTGPGISAADQSKLFQEFQQADNAITRKKGGAGLGLAISKRIIEMHGGKIWVGVTGRPGLDVFTHTARRHRAASQLGTKLAGTCRRRQSVFPLEFAAVREAVVGLGCVKTPKSNFRIEGLSPLRQFRKPTMLATAVRRRQ